MGPTARTHTTSAPPTTMATAASDAGQSSSPAAAVPVRRASFEQGLAELDKYFAAGGNVFESHLAVVMSTMFPDGEEFFIRSVRHYRDHITDPVLKRQVAGFIGQESVHGREHRLANARFAELGYLARSFERLVNLRLRLVWKLLSPELRLAGTAAVEHFTASLAELILAEPEVRDRFGDSVIRELFQWHALEELEHKAVAFDVYRAVGGSERKRILVMKVVRIGFFAALSIMVAFSMAADREARSLRRLRTDWKAFRTSPLMSRRFMAMLSEYDRPGFHPDDRDTDALLERCRDEFFGERGTLLHLLAA